MSKHDAIELRCLHGIARVHPIGATVFSWVPRGGTDVLWVAEAATYAEGHAIRGGIPVCWPWFADAGSPAHGVVRKRRWTLQEHTATDAAATATFALDHEGDGWAFSLTYRVRLDDALTVELVHQDRSDTPTQITGALHTYLRMEAASTMVHGLSATAWDKLASADRGVAGPVSLAGPIDLVVPHDGPVTVEGGSHPLVIEGLDHTDVVLWNPGDHAPSHVAPGEQRGFACVETAIVSAPRALAPGGQTRLGARLVPRSPADA